MPIYEYECENGHRCEKRLPMEDRHNFVCPQCGKRPQLLISPLAKQNPFDQRNTLTVFDSDGIVIGKRYDLKPTPHPEQYYDVKKIREDQMADVYAEAKKGV